MTELDLIIDLHRRNPRQGPGSDADTQRAMLALPWATDVPLHIADIGCGTGASTRQLAQHYPQAQVTAIDLFPAFLEALAAASPSLNIQPLAADMTALPLAPASLDLIWSEGAIYNMGFGAGITAWRDFLKPGGYLAVSEITWLTETRPQALTDYWMAAYPEISTASHKLRQLEQQGYSPVAYFYLPVSSWLDTYYAPLEAQFDAFLAQNADQPLAAEIVANERHEIALYRQYRDFYSYGFYVAQKC